MIEVKLSFATIEAAISALAAVRAAEGKSDTPKPETPKPDAKPKKGDAATPPTAAPAPAAASPTPPAESKSPDTSSGVTREQVSAAVVAAAKTNRAAVVEALGKFGAKAAKDLKDEQLAEFAAALETALKGSDDLG